MLKDVCTAAGVDHQYSDGIFHSPVYAYLDVGNLPSYITDESMFVPKLAWCKASENDIDMYKNNVETALGELEIPECINNCTDKFCALDTHRADINSHYDKLLNIMMTACDHIPRTCKPEDNTRIPGWTKYVKPFKDKSMYWRHIFDMQKPNASHYVTHMMRTSRNAYHYAIRRVKSHRKLVERSNFMDSMLEGDRNFMQEVKKVKRQKKAMPSSVDGLKDPQHIADKFASNYKDLFNSCENDDDIMHTLWNNVNSGIQSSDDTSHALYTPCDIRKAINCLKNGKQDGVYDLMSDNFIHAPVCFSESLCDFYNACIRHGFVPERMLVSTMLPLPKGGGKSDKLSDNYRAIALCVLFLKIFEYCVLNVNRNKLLVSGLQFAYKPEHSTTQCTWLAKEVISYYKSKGSDVYACLLDCSKAFDKIRHDVLFKKLYDKGLPPLTVRIIMNMYMKGSAQVKWDGCTSTSFNVTNGVKQGSVISPLFFTLYVDELIDRLEHSGYGCKIGTRYYGILVYADDIFLLSPTAYGLQKMLNICNDFAHSKGLHFNAKKTQCILFHQKHCDNIPSEIRLTLNGDVLVWFSDVIHLGHRFSCCLGFKKDIGMRKGAFIQCVNEICTEFAFAHPLCHMKLLQIYGSSFYGSNLWDFYSQEFLSLCKTWNIAIRRIFKLSPQTHCRFLPHISLCNHVSHMLKCRFIKFMVGNICAKNAYVNYVANLCFKDASTCSGRNVLKIISEYDVNFNVLTQPHHIKHVLNQKYGAIKSNDIHGEEWKISMISELIDCLNGFSDNDLCEEENIFLLTDVCIS